MGILPFVILIVIFYFLLIRPQQKSMKKHKEMVGSLKAGDNVVTRGGVYGRITAVRDDVVTVEVADNVRLRVDKNSITTRKAEGSE